MVGVEEGGEKIPEIFEFLAIEQELGLLTEVGGGGPAALEALNPGTPRVLIPSGVQPIAIHILHATRLDGHGPLLLLHGELEELIRLVVHLIEDGERDAMVDELEEAPLRASIRHALGDPRLRQLLLLLIVAVAALQSRQVHYGQLPVATEVVVGDGGPIRLWPYEVAQILRPLAH